MAKRDWVIEIQRSSTGGANEIPRREASRCRFSGIYYRTNRPVIITGMLDDWPAMAKWSPAYFRAQYAQREVEVQFGREADAQYEMNSVAHKRKMAFGEYRQPGRGQRQEQRFLYDGE